MKHILLVSVMIFLCCTSHTQSRSIEKLSDSTQFATKEAQDILAVLPQRQDAYMAFMVQETEKGNDLLTSTYDWSLELAETAKKIKQEDNSTLRQALLFVYLQMVSFHAATFDTSLVDRAFHEILPISELWKNPDAPDISYLTGKASSPGIFEEYVHSLIAKHPSRKLAATVLYRLGSYAYYSHQQEKAHLCYERLKKEFPDSQEVEYARQEYSSERNIMPGKKVPTFSFNDIDNSGASYSDISMIGRYYLIDIWSTDCKPCVADMPTLHTAYEQYKDRNFTIISLTLNGPATQQFRKGKWSMPWLNAYFRGFRSPNDRFEVGSIPKTLLVDPQGMIIAEGMELRGKRLLATLGRFLGQQKQ